jgi:hypothetical protein
MLERAFALLGCVQTSRAPTAETGCDLPVCADSCSTDTVAARPSTRARLIVLLMLGLVKPSTFTIHTTRRTSTSNLLSVALKIQISTKERVLW